MQALHTLESKFLLLDQENIDTDQIIPARFLTKTDKNGFGQELFYDWRYTADGHKREDVELNRRQAEGLQILVAGTNFGCGSSREHAVWALRDYGFRVVIAPSIGDIFKSNALKNGVLPIEIASDVLAVLRQQRDSVLSIDVLQQIFGVLGRETYSFTLDAFAKTCLLQGVDALGYLMQKEAQIYAFEARRPLC